MNIKKLGLFSIFSLLTACAATSTHYSYSDLPPDQAQIIVQDATDYLASTLAPGRTTLQLAPASDTQTQAVSDAFAQALSGRGFGITSAAQDGDAVLLRYYLTHAEQDYLLRLIFNNVRASRIYMLDSSGQLRSGPLTVISEDGQ